MKKLLLIQPGAYGDIFLCAPIAKWYADRGYEVHWPVREQFISTLEYFDYVKPILLSEDSLHPDWLRSDVMKILPMINDYDKVINLADRGPHPTAQKSDENFEFCKYRLAEVPFEEKNNLVWTRDEEKEQRLVELLDLPKNYTLAHLTNSHGDEAPCPETNFPVIKVKEVKGFTIVDWYSVIKGASKVYCVESGVHQFIDGWLKPDDKDYFLLKKGPVSEGTRHTHSKFWDLTHIGKNSKIHG